MNNNSKTFIIEAKLIHETTLAWLLDCEGDQAWFSKSQVRFDKDKEELEAPSWILKEKFPNEDWS